MTNRLTRPLLALCLSLLLAGTARAEMVRELVTLHGALPISVVGTGLVTGLANTGDKAVAAQTLLRKYLGNMDMDFDAASMATGNIAIVKVTAEIPPFSHPGTKFPITVTSMNDAKSLAGGQLVSCDLFTPNGERYGYATGQIVTGANHLTRGTIPVGANSGGLQLAAYEFSNVVHEGFLRLNLNIPDWANAYSIARQINQTPALNPNLADVSMFAETEDTRPVARAVDAGQVLVMIPEQYIYDQARYIDALLSVPVAVSRPAKILVNRARNTIVVTGDITVNNAMVSVQDKMVTVRPETEELPAGYTLANETPRNLVEIDGPGSYADLQGMIDTLNAMGLSTEQVITVFEELRAAGAIHALYENQ